MNQTIVTSVILTCLVVFYTYLFLQGRIMRHFNLVDKRLVWGNETVLQRLNTLMIVSDTRVYSFVIWGDPVVSLTSTFHFPTGESVEKSFKAKSLDEAVNEAYNWALSKELIKE